MVLKRTFGAALLRSGVSAAILAFVAGAALAESVPSDPLDDSVVIDDGMIDTDPPNDHVETDPTYVVEPICEDCNGEIMWLEVEEEMLITGDWPNKEELLVDEGMPVDESMQVDVGGEVVIEGDGEVVFTTTDCGGCELQNTAVEPAMVQRHNERANEGARDSGAAFDAVASRPQNICTTPELYAAWLCEWQGYPRP